MLVPYSKPWLSYNAQLKQLQSRGLVVPDEPAAIAFLSHVNYYRLSGYCLAFEDGSRHTFLPGTTFSSIRNAYTFDFRLRDLLSEALEVVEVDFRTAVAHHFGKVHGAFGHTQPANFFQARPRSSGNPGSAPRGFRFQHAEWLTNLRTEIERSKETFVAHFRQTYSNFPDLPIWVATEIMSFGTLSKMCAGMSAPDKRAVAQRYGLQPTTLASWIHHLSVIRNLCAHHARVWDRLWSVRPELPAGHAWRPPHLSGNGRLGATLLILNHLLRRCPAAGAFPREWHNRVSELLTTPPATPVALRQMGITPEWFAGPLWSAR
jgi:abortive infection bacteriophage resistance protein